MADVPVTLSDVARPVSELTAENLTALAGALRPEIQFPIYSVTDFGAAPTTGATANRVAIQTAVDSVVSAGSGTVYVPPIGDYYITGGAGGNGIDISALPEGSAFIGGGANSTLRATGAAMTNAILFFDQGNDVFKKSVVIADLTLRGACGKALYCRGLSEGTVRNIIARDGAMDVAFDFDDMFGCFLANLYAKIATCSIANFRTGGSFNANDCVQWYTSATTPINFLIDSDFGKGNTFTQLTAQGGTIGLEVREMKGSMFNGFYSENVLTPIKLGDEATSKLAKGLTMSGFHINGRSSTLQAGETRRADIYAELCEDVTFIGPEFNAVNFGVTAYVEDTGTRRAVVAVILKDKGTTDLWGVDRIEVLDGGAGYATAPAVTIGEGTGFAATATISGGVVTGVTVDTEGTGITASGNPLAIEYKSARGLKIINPSIRANTPAHNGDEIWRDFPLYPFIGRAPLASTKSYVSIEGDRSLHTNAAYPTELKMTKTPTNSHDYVIEYRDDAGVLQTVSRNIPEYA